MRRVAYVLCAGLLGASVGCTWDLGNTRVAATVKFDEQAVNATLDGTVTKIQAELVKRQMKVDVNAEADGRVRLTSVTPNGDRFAIVCSRARLPDGKEQTRVRVEWDKAADRELWGAIVGVLAVNVTQSPS